jgi:hypothetical protein
VATKKRSTTANGKKPSTRKTQSRAHKRTAAPAEVPIDETLPESQSSVVLADPVVTVVPEPSFAARIAPPPAPRPRPEQRRGIFFDVENTSRAQDIEYVLHHLMIDRVGIDTDFTAVGNWRVIGHETARLLAQNGANLVHSAPSTGVRDWSDLRIAVAAGVWLAGTRPGDMIDVVSDDQAFDAVGDVASSLGVQYRRLSYRSLRGHVIPEASAIAEVDGRGSRRRGRGGRGRRGGTARRHPEAPRHPAPQHRQPPPRPAAPVVMEADADAHTAPHDELIDVVSDLMQTAPGGVTLDQLANALRERGFRRTPGSPRLITRLKRIKELDVNRSGLIRLVDGPPAGTLPHDARTDDSAAERQSIEPPDEDADDAFDGEPVNEGGQSEAAPAEPGQRRRRRRRGGRRRRGRRGSGNGGNGGTDGSAGGEVLAAAAPASTTEG